MDIHTPPVSVAAFFKNNRIAGAAGRSAQAAGETLARFFERYSYESCSADQLLALADLALLAKDLGVARTALERALRKPDRVHLAAYKLGRLEIAANNPAMAAAHFEVGTVADPAFPYNWMGWARALAAQGCKEEAAVAAERFASFGVRPHTDDELAVLAGIGDALFEFGARVRSRPIYEVLRAFAPPSRKVTVRLAESSIAAGDYADAIAMLRPAHEEGQLDSWGRRALAQCESQAGHHATAVALAETIVEEHPADPGFISTWLEALLQGWRSDAFAEPPWRGALARFGGRVASAAALELAIRAALADGDVAAATAALEGVALRPSTRLFYVAIDTAYALLAAGEIDSANQLAGRLAEAPPTQAAALLLQTDIALRQQRWDVAAQALSAIAEPEAGLPAVLIKWFEHACFVGDTARATDLQAQIEAMGLPSRQAVLPILRFLAEQQMWAEIIDRAVAWLSLDFRYDQIGYVLFRAARRTVRHAELMHAIVAIAGWQDSPDLLRLHTTLAWDTAGTLDEMELLTNAPGHNSPAMARRIAVQRRLLARASIAPCRRALFLCTDAPYLCATMVALHSALSHSAPGREDCFVVVDGALAERCERLTQPLRDAGFAVTVVPASSIVADGSKLNAAYGLFTSGHMLASAAYYRIYCALYLQRLGHYQRALYLDSDVLVRAPLDRLFEAGLDGHPLAARLETPRPEVSRAIALHQLEPGLYFNSGVLLFDLSSDRLQSALEASVAAIADEDVTLLFHDQCALNLGFRDAFKPMDMAWNKPVGEATRLADLSPDDTVLHYLDRPKPWSAAYDGECGTLWFDAWEKAAEAIGAAEAVALFAMNTE